MRIFPFVISVLGILVSGLHGQTDPFKDVNSESENLAQVFSEGANHRTFTSSDGHSFRGVLHHVSDGVATLRDSDFKIYEVPLSRLSQGDQDYIAGFGDEELAPVEIEVVPMWRSRKQEDPSLAGVFLNYFDCVVVNKGDVACDDLVLLTELRIGDANPALNSNALATLPSGKPATLKSTIVESGDQSMQLEAVLVIFRSGREVALHKFDHLPTSTPQTKVVSQVPKTQPTIQPLPQQVATSGNFSDALAGSPKVAVKLPQTSLYGLLVIELGESKTAGSASKMHLTALPSVAAGVPASLNFNQEVGSMMSGALKEVIRFLRLRHSGWPYDHNIEVAFADKYVDKDGPSAGVASALLLDSMMTGEELEGLFAVTGALNANGDVQPIGGTASKVKGAISAGCKRIAIPKKNAASLMDGVILEGAADIVSIPIFTIATFDEAKAVALADTGDAVTTSLAEFAEVQSLYKRDPKGFSKLLRNQAVASKLAGIVERSPNFLSARILLDIARGNLTKHLSLAGSLDWIDQRTGELIRGIRESATAEGLSFRDDGLVEATSELERMRTTLDPRCKPYSDSIVDFGQLIRTYIQRPPAGRHNQQKANQQIQAAANAVDLAYEAIMKDPEVMGTLIQ